jgi:hypothetical protein
MPNSGMLDHPGYKPRPEDRAIARRNTLVFWMDSWPTKIGYQTPRTFKVSEFSRHRIHDIKKEVSCRFNSLDFK